MTDWKGERVTRSLLHPGLINRKVLSTMVVYTSRAVLLLQVDSAQSPSKKNGAGLLSCCSTPSTCRYSQRIANREAIYLSCAFGFSSWTPPPSAHRLLESGQDQPIKIKYEQLSNKIE